MAQYTKAIKLSTLRKSANSLYNSVVFFSTPEIAENRTVSYVEISDIRQPASILIYMGSPSRNWSIGAKLIARSKSEADVSFRNINLLKSWCVTHSTLGSVGQNSTVTRVNVNDKVTNLDQNSPSDTSAGNAQDGTTPGAQVSTSTPKTFAAGDLFTDTPQVLLFEGYAGQFRRIPVVVTGLNITYPQDVDYIQNSTGVWVPIVQDISVSLKEARNITGTASIASFNLQQFKQGTLQYW
jgi:hypothetical protein